MIVNACNKGKEVDLIMHNAHIYTVDSVFSTAECIVIDKGKIIDIGGDGIMEKYQAKELKNMHGKYIYPGFIDAHCHFYGYAKFLQQADLTGSKSMMEVVERLGVHYEGLETDYILGRGWDQNLFTDKEFPDNTLLNEAFPDKIVLITRIDGHAAIANSRALEEAGVKEIIQVEGGNMLHNNGIPTGILIDKAIEIVQKIIPEMPEKELVHWLRKAEDNCFKVGLTTLADAGLEKDKINLIDSLQKKEVLAMPLYIMLSANKENYEEFMYHGIYRTEKMHIQSIKLFADGALGSRGAKLFEDYSDDAGNNGLIMHDVIWLKQQCLLAYNYGYQVNTHCIGDSAVRMMLYIYKDILGGKNDKRWRIEHAQVVADDDINIFGQYNIIPSIQSTHATSDMYWAEKRLGEERIKNAYAYKTLLEQNGWIANGTDFPIEQINPLYTFCAAVFRQDRNAFPENGFQMENALSREDALRSITIWAAKSIFEEEKKGSLEIGKNANFVVLDIDLIKASMQEIYSAKVMEVYLNGSKVESLKLSEKYKE
jgi:predicted amidohydrolase YtcJ